jgi:hypothetical protein
MEVIPIRSANKDAMNVHELLECYNVAKEEHDEEDPRNVEVPDTEGEHVVEGTNIESIMYTQPINMRKVNIGTRKNQKFAQIGDYWSDETMEKIEYLLCEYHDIFPNTLS